MDEYISRKAVVKYLKGYSEKELNHNGHFGMITSSVLDKAERAISEMPAADVQPVSHWISVKDRLPDPFTWVLVYSKQGNYMNLKVDYVHSGRWFNSMCVTHWMPLPEPPESEDAE